MSHGNVLGRICLSVMLQLFNASTQNIQLWHAGTSPESSGQAHIWRSSGQGCRSKKTLLVLHTSLVQVGKYSIISMFAGALPLTERQSSLYLCSFIHKANDNW